MNRIITESIMKRIFAGFLLSSFLVSAPSPGYSQAPRTISHQGRLTDLSGLPVADASRSMTFKLYDVPSGGSALWSETKSVATVNGVFSTELGSVTSLAGVNFDQELWLSVKVDTDAEMPQRTRLTSVPNAIGLVMPYRDSLRIETLDLGTDGSEIYGDDISVHAADAFLGLYSNANGIAGSGLYLAEISSGALTNKWSIYRSTTGAQSSLRFTFGSDPQYVLNPLVMQLDTDGKLSISGAVHADSVVYNAPKVGYFSVPAAGFTPEEVDGLIEYIADNRFAYFTAGVNNRTFYAPVHLPHGATITHLYCEMYDADASTNITCALSRYVSETESSSVIANVTTSGSDGDYKIDTDPLATVVVDNLNNSYFVSMRIGASTWPGNDIRVRQAVVEYTLPGAP